MTRRRKTPLSYSNNNALTHKLKTALEALTAEKKKSKLRLQLLKRMISPEPLSERMVKAIVTYVDSGGDEKKQYFVEVPGSGAIVPGFSLESKDENIYASLTMSDL